MSEQSIDGVFGLTDREGRRVTLLIEAKPTGEVDSRGRTEWDYHVAGVTVDSATHYATDTEVFDGTIHWDPAYGQYGLLSRIFSAVHLRVVERDSDEYMQRKATNND